MTVKHKSKSKSPSKFQMELSYRIRIRWIWVKVSSIKSLTPIHVLEGDVPCLSHVVCGCCTALL